VKLRDRVSSALRTLLGYPTPEGGVVPNYRPSLVGHPYYLNPVVLDHAKAVRLVATVRACVMQKASDIASQPVVIERETSTGWEPVERTKGNIVDVWHAGNPRQTGREVIRDLQANFITHGNAYLVVETFGMKTPSELWVMPSHLVVPIPGERRMPKAYLFNGGALSYGGQQLAIPAQNVVAFHDFQPEDEPIGASPLDAVQFQYETRYDLMRFFQKVVRSGGAAAGYFRVPVPASGIPFSIPEDQKRELAKAIRRSRRDIDLPTILDALEFQRMGLTMPELQFIENTTLTDSDICRAIGVPPWYVGVRDEASNRAAIDPASQERMYWMKLRSEVELRDATLTEKLGPMFAEENVRFRTDLTTVPALNQPLMNSAQQIVALTGRPVFTVNEMRKIAGQPLIDDPSADELAEPKPGLPFGQQTPSGIAPSDDVTTAVPADTKPAPEPGAKAKRADRLIDTPERAERWRGQDRLMKRYEEKFRRAYVAVIRERGAKLRAKLEAGALRSAKWSARSIDLEDLFAPDPEDETRIAGIYEDLIAARGREAAREIALELEVNINAQTVRHFIQARQALGLNGAMQNLMDGVRTSLAEGIALNESLSELAARVGKYLEEAEQGRALTIARTEAVSAYNFASVEAWRQSGDVEELEWLSARDSAVRETHAEADGQVVGINGDGFDVGGETLEYPGDPSGSPEETINCRCVALPVVNERARARMWERSWFPAPSTNGHTKPKNRIAEHAR